MIINSSQRNIFPAEKLNDEDYETFIRELGTRFNAIQPVTNILHEGKKVVF